MISGMELLLQAVERRDSVADGSATGSAAGNNERDVQPNSSLPPKKRIKLGSRAVSVAGTHGSVASALSHCSCHDDAPTVNSQRTEIATPPADSSSVLQMNGGSVVVPHRSVNDKKQANGRIASFKKSNDSDVKPLKRRCGRATGKRKQSTSGVKDVDGNDVGMGYFSAMLRRSGSPPATEESRTTEQRTESPASDNPQDAGREEPEAAAPAVDGNNEVTSPSKNLEDEASYIARKSLLYQAYLRALDQALSRQVNQQTAW